MPESPEIKKASINLQPLVGKLIQEAKVLSGRYSRDKTIANLSSLNDSLITDISCYGKLIYITVLKNGITSIILSTFGMTGKWVINYPHELKHERIRLYFADGSIASFVDMRNFGTFKIVTEAELEKKLKGFGPDILVNSEGSFLKFLERIKKYARFKPIAEAIMDQRIAAGCGNYIRADAMYMARLSPHKVVNTLNEEELKMIWNCLVLIAKCSFTNKDPRIIIMLNESEEIIEKLKNNSFKNLVYSCATSPFGGTISKYTDANGRTVWYSPSEQSYVND